MQKFQAAEGKKPEPKPEVKKEPEVKPQPKQEDKKPEPEKPKTTFKEPKELRAELDRRGTELEKMRGDYSKMESKLKELESKGQDASKLAERMTQLEQEYHTEVTKRDAIIRRLKKEESPEFVKNFKEPFQEAAADAAAVFNQLQVVVKTNEETGENQTRQASWDHDFSRLFAMDIANARREAKRMFPEDYDTVMGFYNDLHAQKRKMDRALKHEQDQAAELEKQEEATRIKRDQEIESFRTKVSKELEEKVEDYRDPVDDPEIADLRKRGYALFDAKPQNLQQHLVKEAHIRHRVAAYDVHRLKIARLQQKINELTAKAEEETAEVPGKTRKPSGERSGSKPEKPWDQEALEVLKNA